MTTTQPFGGPQTLPLAAAASRKRPAEQAACAIAQDSFAKRPCVSGRAIAALRLPTPEREAVVAFMPTPAAHAHDTSGWAEAVGIAIVSPTPLQVTPALPTAPPTDLQDALTRREKHLFFNAYLAASPAKRLEQCLRTWMRQGSAQLDLQALENVLLALGERDGLRDDDVNLQEAQRIVTLSRTLFGDTIEPRTRGPWYGTLGLDLQEDCAADAAVWDRRSEIVTRLHQLRQDVGPTHRDAVTQKVLTAAARRSTAPLTGVYDLLSRHAAFEMPLGDFAKLALGARTDAWLQGANWGLFVSIADIIAQLAQPPARAQRMLDAVLGLRRSDIEQVSRTMARLCQGADAPTTKAMQLALLSAIEKLGYNAVLGCRTLLVNHLDCDQRLQLINALNCFSKPSPAMVAAQVMHAGLVACSRRGSVQSVIDFFTQHAGTYLQDRHELLTILQDANLESRWLDAVHRLQSDGFTYPQVADLAAAELLLGGKISCNRIVFRSGDRTWHTCITNASLLMGAAKQWGLLRPASRRLTDWVVDGAGETILNSGGHVVPYIRTITSDPQLRIAYAQALRDVPSEQMATCLREMAQLGQSWALDNSRRARLVEPMVAAVQGGASDLARALAAPMLARLNPHVPDAREKVLRSVLKWAHRLHPLVRRLQSFNGQGDTAVARAVAVDAVTSYYAHFLGTHPAEGTQRLQRLLTASEPWFSDARRQRPLATLLNAELRVGAALPQFLDRAHARGVREQAVWLVMTVLAGTPINGVMARIFLAALQTDQVLAEIAAAANPPALQWILNDIAIAAQARMANTQNVHDAVRIRATDTAAAFLRTLDPAMALDAQARLAAIDAFIDHLDANSPRTSVWFRRRTTAARTTLENARFVLTGPYHFGQDLSRSVAETPAYRDICALVWRAIDLYKHPSGTREATAQEQKQMREDVILGLAECVADETGFRICPVGFKQRVIGILQGDERYPQVLVDATNAAQMLTVVGQEFALSLEGRDPTRVQLAEFMARARALAQGRLADEPHELAKFRADLDAWVAMDYDYEPAASSQSR